MYMWLIWDTRVYLSCEYLQKKIKLYASNMK